MKIVTASNGKKTLKISKKEWQNIGKKAGWIRTSDVQKFINDHNDWKRRMEDIRKNNPSMSYDEAEIAVQKQYSKEKFLKNDTSLSEEETNRLADQDIAKLIELRKRNRLLKPNLFNKDDKNLRDWFAGKSRDTGMTGPGSDVELLGGKPGRLLDDIPKYEPEQMQSDLKKERDKLLDQYNAGKITIEQLKNLTKQLEASRILKIVTTSNGKKILKISKKEWQNIGKKSGWNKTAIIPSDGIADGGEPYTDDEMNLIENSPPENVYVDANDQWSFQLPNGIRGTVVSSQKPWWEAQEILKKDMLIELLETNFTGDAEIRMTEDLLALMKIRGSHI